MSRFSNIKFNLVRAIEILGDMNHIDMDVMAPPSGHDFFKEHEVAERLNDCLSQLYRDGFFDDCDLREVDSTSDEYEDYDDDDGAEEEEEVDYDDEDGVAAEGHIYDTSRTTPRSEGFSIDESDLEEQSAGRAGSKESLSHRFKRYMRRILPGRRPANRGAAGHDLERDDEHLERNSGRLDDDEVDDETYDPDSVIASDDRSAGASGRRSRSRSGSRSDSRRPRSASSSSSAGSRRSGRSSRSSSSRRGSQRVSRARARR